MVEKCWVFYGISRPVKKSLKAPERRYVPWLHPQNTGRFLTFSGDIGMELDVALITLI